MVPMTAPATDDISSLDPYLAAPMVWRARHEPGARFLLCWLVPSWIVFEAVLTKLPHYVLPLYPAIAILFAGILERDGLSKARWLVLGSVIVLGLPLDWPDRQRRDANRAAWYAEQVRLERPRRSATWVRDGTDPEGQPMSRRFNRLANLQG